MPSVLVSVVFVFVVTQDQSTEALRILADPNDKFSTAKIIGWDVVVALLSWAVYLSGRATGILQEKSEPIIRIDDQTVHGYVRADQVWNAGVALLLAALTLGGACFGLAAAVDFQGDWHDETSPDSLLTLAGLACGLSALVIFFFGFYYCTKSRLELVDVEGGRGQLPPTMRNQIIWLFVICGAVFLFNIFLPFAPAPYVLVLFFGTLLGALVLLFEISFRLTFNIPAFLILTALILSGFNLADNHTIRTLPTAAQPTACTVPYAAEAFTKWLGARGERDHFARYPVFIVAAEGGGMRAAYMTIEALRAIETRAPGFSDHLFAVVGVSGGSVGAALFAASRRGGDWEQWSRAGAAAATALQADLLSPVMTGLLGPDLLARLLPFDALDRARWIEDALNSAWTGAGQMSLTQLGFRQAWSPEARAPALILLGTRVDGRADQSGTRLAFSHVRFKETGPQTICDIAPGLEVPLLTAAFVSARFPIVTPAATIPAAEGPVRVVDGGYFENSGVTTVLELQRELASMLEPARADLFVIRISNSAATTTVRWQVRPDAVSTSFSEVLSPVRAALGTRDARADLAVKELSHAFPANQLGVIELRRSDVPVPLGWWLSTSAENEIDRQIAAPFNNAAFEMVAGVLARRQLRPVEPQGSR